MKKNKSKSLRLMTMAMAVLLVGLTVLTGCGKSPDPVTGADFNQVAKDLDYAYQDITSEYGAYDHIKSVIVALKDDTTRVEYYLIDSADNAKGVFESNKELISSAAGNGTTSKTVENSNYAKFTLKNSDTAFVVVRVSNTVIYAAAAKDDAGELDTFIDKLGY